MVSFGYTAMCEQRGPSQLVDDIRGAEASGFDFALVTDHFHPWVEAQGHSPYAWSVLGAAAHVTERIWLMSFVTAPIIRYHPVIVAQKAATVGVMADGRFRLGLGAGERLNENVVGLGYPSVHIRHEMFIEAIEIIRELFKGGYVTHRGTHYDVDHAKLFDLPETPPEIGIATSGPASCEIAGRLGDLMISTDPEPELLRMFSEAGGQGKPVACHIPVCWGPDEAEQRKLAYEQFPWTMGGWKLQSELPNTTNFEAFASIVREEDVAGKIPCGPDIDPILEAAQPFIDAGYTDISFVQIGSNQAEFQQFFQEQLGPALRAL
ncbi:MAG: TIGR03557 family F420-dependent LLM class oxidoreductase [Sphaerobacteraceae bacterium]|nr:MAG: TIGR03557 family F420-dependent LLM class oxidoreductase [Sphaerobacteraceae bacterium]